MKYRTYILMMLAATAMQGKAAVTDDPATVGDGQADTIGNAALRIYQPTASKSRLSLFANSSPAAIARIPQLGTGGRAFGAEAATFQMLSPDDCVWGEAAYTNGRRYDVVWNETSDFLSLYPYVLGDPRGGDTKYEQYELNGGYSRRIRRASIGMELGYRALSEYRDRDPRPNNTVADLHAQLAFSWNFAAAPSSTTLSSSTPSSTAGGSSAVALPLSVNALSLALDAGRYKQTSDLVYLNELGAQKEYHLTGLGNDFARFSGASNSTFYKGHHLGGSIDWLNNTWVNGELSATIGYRYTFREKILSDLNRLPLNELKLKTLNGRMGWKNDTYAVSIHASQTKRSGQDNLFGDATGNVYPQIGSRQQFEGKETTADLHAAAHWRLSPLWRLDVAPSLAYTTFTARHNDTGNRLSTKDFHLGATVQASYKRLVGQTSIRHRANSSHSLTMNSAATESISDVFSHIDRYFGKGETVFGLGAAYRLPIGGSRTLIFTADWNHDSYLGGESANEYRMSVEIEL